LPGGRLSATAQRTDLDDIKPVVQEQGYALLKAQAAQHAPIERPPSSVTFSITTDTLPAGVPTTCMMRNDPWGSISGRELPTPSIVSDLFATPLAGS
jgi:hypothetical protein